MNQSPDDMGYVLLLALAIAFTLIAIWLLDWRAEWIRADERQRMANLRRLHAQRTKPTSLVDEADWWKASVGERSKLNGKPRAT